MAEVKIKNLYASGPDNTATSAKTSKPNESIWNKDISLGPVFSAKEKKHLFHLLGVLLESGLSITESLDILIDQTRKKQVKEVINALRTSLLEGVSLSKALETQAKHFSQFEIFSIKMAESSGQMNLVLRDLASFHEKRIALQRKFTQAFSYPLVVILIAGGVLSFMVSFVVPMFRDIFDRFDAELPWITLRVLDLSDFMRNWGLLLLLAMAILIVIGVRARKTESFQKLISRTMLAIPLFGPIILKVQLSRFCYTLALLLKSKVNLDQALELLEKIVSFYPLKSTIPSIRNEVIEGKTLYMAISNHNIYPPLLRQMVKVGEKTARLDDMLTKLAQNLEEESDLKITQLTNLLEPLLIVILGLIVGLILVSMYLPMFELSNAITG